MNVAKFAKRGMFLAGLLSITAASAFAQSAVNSGIQGLFPYDEDFENWSAGPVYGNAPTGWTISAEDGSYITNIADGVQGQVLALNTEGQTIQANLEGAEFQSENIFVDAAVKFVVSEDDPASIPNDVKIAFWLNASSNLVAYHGYDTGSGVAPTTTVFTTTVLDPANFYRLTIEAAYVSGDTMQGAFKIYIDGNVLTAASGYGDTWAVDYSESTPPEGGYWFLSALDSAHQINAIAFQGTGMVDDLSVHFTPPPAPATTWALVLGATSNGSFTTNGAPAAAGTYEFEEGYEVTVAAVPAAGYDLDSFTTNGVAVGGSVVVFDDVLAGVTNTLAATFALHTTAVGVVAEGGAVTYYDTIDEAIAAANGDTVKLFDDIVVDDWILIEDAVTLDLNGNTITRDAANWPAVSPAHDSLVAIKHGGSLTLNDSSDPSTGAIGSASDTLWSGIKLTISGDTNDTNPATLVVNGGTVYGYYYAVSGNGSAGRGNTVTTINGGHLVGTCVDDSVGIFQPQAGTLTINGGTIEGANGVWIKSGTCTCNVSGGEIIGNGTQAAYRTSTNGFNCTGDAFVVDNVGYPGGAPVPSILGGTFTSANGVAIASYANTANEPIAHFVSGGSFNTDIADDVCEEGYEAVQDPQTGLYGLEKVTYTLTYVTAQGTAPAAVDYDVETANFALAAAPTAQGYTFLGWVIGDVTNAAAATFVVADHLEDTTATAAWEEAQVVDPYPNSVKIDNDFVIVSPDDQAGAALEFGAPTIGATTVTVPFDATLVGSANGLTGLYLKVKYDLLSADFATIPATITAGEGAGTATFSLSDLPQNAAQVFFFGFTTEAIQ